MMADLVGKQVGEYRLVRFLGNGTFGDVYDAARCEAIVNWLV